VRGGQDIASPQDLFSAAMNARRAGDTRDGTVFRGKKQNGM